MSNRTFLTKNDRNTSDTSSVQFNRSRNLVIAFLVLYVFLALVIIAGNTLVIVAFKKIRSRATINMFFVSLAISDLLVGVVSIPLWM